ncbi:MAG: DUF4230 domain-containing protein, partial [Spirochaetales bacterium]|nr:DUF4230 domain-containing protein [Spirochaetales bacterium]
RDTTGQLLAACAIPYSVPMRTVAFRTAGALILLVLLSGCAPVARLDTISIQEQLTDLLELHTHEHIYRDVVYFGEEKSFLFIRTVDRRILFAINIRVRAGIDLGRGFTIAQDSSDPERIYVQLPAAEILSVDADEKSIHEYFIREQGGRIGLLEMTEQLAEVKTRTEADAVKRGILGKAETNARNIVRNFLAMAGFSQVIFAPAPAPDEGELQG